MLQILTSTDFANAISAAITGAISLAAVLFFISIIVLVLIVALITWIVKKVWYAGENRKYRSHQRNWRQYQRDYERREKALLHAEEQERRKQSVNPTADDLQFNPDWRWDPETKLWVHRSQWGKK